MGATLIPHFRFPPVIGGDGHIDTVEQDSEDDILGCVYMAAKTPIGTRLYAPEFGISDYTFTPSPVAVSQLQGEILSSEPRADLDVASLRTAVEDIVTVGVQNVG